MTEPLTPAQQALATHHLDFAEGLAVTLAKRFGVRADDLRGPARLGLVEAASRFEPGMGKEFAAFARGRIRGAIVDSLRRNGALDKAQRRAEQSAAWGILESVVRVGNPLKDGEEEIQAYLDDDLGPAMSAMFASAAGTAWKNLEQDRESNTKYEIAIAALAEALSRLPKKQKRVIELLFIHSGTYENTAVETGGTVKEVRIAKEAALKRLHALLKERGVEEMPPPPA